MNERNVRNRRNDTAGQFQPSRVGNGDELAEMVRTVRLLYESDREGHKGSDVQVAILLTLLGAEAMDIYRSFKWVTAADKDDIVIGKAKFKEYFTPRVNETYERCKFLKIKQEQGETFERFLTDLKNLVSWCGYHIEEKSKVLRDQIVMGAVFNVVREKLLDRAALTLNTAVDMCRSSEVTGQLLMRMSANNDPIQPVHAVKQKG